jgi:ABC-type multidrug transport system fused ATPase/permease subunit
MAGRTVLVVAHRHATLEHADQVYVLDRGRAQLRA